MGEIPERGSENGELGERQNAGEKEKRQMENQLKESYSNFACQQQAGELAQVKQKSTSTDNGLQWPSRLGSQ